MAFEIDHEEWHITDDSAAEWALQKIAEEEREFERLKALGELQINKIKEQVEAARKRCENSTRYLNGELAAYFETVKHSKTKSGIEKYALLSGTLQMKPPTKKAMPDDDALVRWLAANGMTDYIKTKQTPAWSELKKQIDISSGVPVYKETGEVVEGVTVEDVPESFEIKFAKEGGEE